MRYVAGGLALALLAAGTALLLMATPRSDPGASPSRPAHRATTSAALAPSAVSVAELALTNITPERAAELLAIAQGDPWVVTQSSGRRVRPVEIYNVGDGKSGIQVRFVDYTGRRTLYVIFLADGTIVERGEGGPGGANYSPAEHALASAIALSDAGVRGRSDGAALVVNHTTGATGGACARSRCLSVFLRPANGDRAHFLIATVDLATEQVIQVDEGS